MKWLLAILMVAVMACGYITALGETSSIKTDDVIEYSYQTLKSLKILYNTYGDNLNDNYVRKAYSHVMLLKGALIANEVEDIEVITRLGVTVGDEYPLGCGTDNAFITCETFTSHAVEGLNGIVTGELSRSEGIKKIMTSVDMMIALYDALHQTQ